MTRSTPRTVLIPAAVAAALMGAPLWAQQTQAPAQPSEPQPAAEAPQAEAPAAAAEAPAEAPAAQAETPAPAAEPQAAPPAGQPQPPQQVVTQSFEAWDIVCLNGEAPCVMRQTGSTQQGQEIMEVDIRRIEPEQTQQGTVEAILSVRVPPSILLRPGLRIQIDGAEPVSIPFFVCFNDGCVTRDPVPNAFIEQLKKGAVAQMTFVAPQNTAAAQMTADISLNGFTAAYNALQP